MEAGADEGRAPDGMGAAAPASLLLLLLPQVLPDPCSFPDSPISSTFAKTISTLLDFMLWDYPVDVPENLRVDEQCWALWHLALAKETLGRLKLVAGSELQELLEAVYTEINFVGQCVNQSFPGCLRFRKANISHLLLEVSSHLGALQPLITQRNFRPCQQYRCQPEPSLPVSTLPAPSSLGALGGTLGPPRPSSLLLLMLGALPVALLLILAAAWRWKQRRTPPRAPRPAAPQVGLAQPSAGGASQGHRQPLTTREGRGRGPPDSAPQEVPGRLL
ncbi:fms-related tyrosine kinase 3 ligand isoform X2 [Sminthopsis crassicaudata]|uniref:fms-related tyrosine kinase 3 ligand isoform X2 n=1 Tax=Sminthopsis crassicaudata TaxID=9301 RepID=UPI003D68EF9D